MNFMSRRGLDFEAEQRGLKQGSFCSFMPQCQSVTCILKAASIELNIFVMGFDIFSSLLTQWHSVSLEATAYVNPTRREVTPLKIYIHFRKHMITIQFSSIFN